MEATLLKFAMDGETFRIHIVAPTDWAQQEAAREISETCLLRFEDNILEGRGGEKALSTVAGMIISRTQTIREEMQIQSIVW